MTNKIVNSKKAPAAVGPYSHSVLAGNTLYISGQLGLDPVSGVLKETVEEQAKQGMKNLGEILAESGMTFADITKTTIFLTDMGDFAAVNEIYGEAFPTNPPARSCVQVSSLPKGGSFEVEAIAVKA